MLCNDSGVTPKVLQAYKRVFMLGVFAFEKKLLRIVFHVTFGN